MTIKLSKPLIVILTSLAVLAAIAVVYIIFGGGSSKIRELLGRSASPDQGESATPQGEEGKEKDKRQNNWSTMDEGPYNDKISYATSTDLLHWTDSGKILAEHASVPDAIYKDGVIYVYFVDVTQDGKPEQIGILRSADKGKTWKERVFATIEGLGEKVAVDPAPFLLPDGRIRLYYFDIAGAMPTPGEEPESGKIYSAISNDGINFVEEEGVRLERKEGLFDPDVVKVGDTYYMYVGDGSGQNVIAATSSDGLTFKEEGTAYTGSAVPNVYYDGKKFILYTVGIQIAFSSDGKTFTKQNYSFQYKTGLTADPGVAKIGENQYLMVYKTKEMTGGSPPKNPKP